MKAILPILCLSTLILISACKRDPIPTITVIATEAITGTPLSGVEVGLYTVTNDGYHISHFLTKDLGITDATGKLEVPFSALTVNNQIGGTTSDHFDAYAPAPDEAGSAVNLSLAANAYWRIQLVNEQNHPLNLTEVRYQTPNGPAAEFLNISTNGGVTFIKVPGNNQNQCIQWVLNPEYPELSGDSCAVFHPRDTVDLRLTY